MKGDCDFADVSVDASEVDTYCLLPVNAIPVLSYQSHNTNITTR